MIQFPHGLTAPHTTLIPTKPLQQPFTDIILCLTKHLPGAHLRPFHSRYSSIASTQNVRQLVTDASGQTGYAFVTSEGAFQETWDTHNINWAIHVKELYAVYKGILLNLHSFHNSNLLVWTDNQSVVYAINKPKSHPSNHTLLLDILTLTAVSNINLRAAYIPTKLNSTADLLSRHVFAAHHCHYTIRRDLLKNLPIHPLTSCAFASIGGKSAAYILGQPLSTITYYTPLKSLFLHS